MQSVNRRNRQSVLWVATLAVLGSAVPVSAQIVVGLAGVSYDTTPGDITVTEQLIHDESLGSTLDGGLTVAGGNVLTLAIQPTYNGPTVVNGGRLVVPLSSALASKSWSIATGATLELSNATNVNQSPALTVTGTGTLVKSGSGEYLLGGKGHLINLAAGAVIHVTAGSLRGADNDSNDTGGFDNNNTWANNQAIIRIDAGASFDGQMAAIRAGALEGAGAYRAGYFGPRNLTLGVGNSSGVFTGILGPNGTTSTGPNLTKTGTGSQVLSGSTRLNGITLSNGALSITPADPATAVIGGNTPFAGTNVTVASPATSVSSLVIGPNTTINTATFAIADSNDAGVGSVTQTGGTVNANAMNMAQNGNNARASYTLSGGTLNIGTNGMTVSTNGGAVTAINISGGDLRMLNNSIIRFGQFNNRTSVITQTGGTVTFYDGGTNAGGTGSLSLRSGTHSYRLNGGILSLPGTSYAGQAANNPFGAVGNLFLSGGTLIPSVATTDFLGDSTKTSASNATWNVFSGAGGAIINTESRDVRFSRGIGHDSALGSTLDGGLTKLGTGTLTLGSSSGYTGPTLVSAGKLLIVNAGLASRQLTTATGATLEFNTASDITLNNVTVSGTGTLVKSGTGKLLLSGGSVNGQLALGSKIDVQQGTLQVTNFDSVDGSWGNARFSLNLAEGTLYEALKADTFLQQLTGSGKLQGGWFSTRTVIVGIENASSEFNGTIAGNGAGGAIGTLALTKTGTGTFTYAGNATYTGQTLVNGGKLIVRMPLRPVTGSLVVTGPGATADLDAPTSSGSATVAGEFSNVNVGVGSLAKVTPTDRSIAAPKVLVTSGLTVDGFLDLTNNDMIVRGGNISALRSAVRTWLTSDAGLPGTVGLGSSSAFYTVDGAFTTLAVFDNSSSTFSTFDGVSVGASDVLVKYTYVGDTNIDGVVDAADLASVLQGLNGVGTGWNFGDVNYDGVIDFTDLGRVQAALRGQGQPLGGTWSGTGGAIPEPSMIALPAVLAAGLLSRPRRK